MYKYILISLAVLLSLSCTGEKNTTTERITREVVHDTIYSTRFGLSHRRGNDTTIYLRDTTGGKYTIINKYNITEDYGDTTIVQSAKVTNGTDNTHTSKNKESYKVIKELKMQIWALLIMMILLITAGIVITVRMAKRKITG